jgi:transcription initiation factor TFIIH subunit 2
MSSGSDSDSFDEGDLTARGRKSKGKGGVRFSEKGKQKAKDVRFNTPCRHYDPSTDIALATTQQGYAWEATYTRSWDTVQEDEAGSLTGAVAELLARGRRRRYATTGSITHTSAYPYRHNDDVAFVSLIYAYFFV